MPKNQASYSPRDRQRQTASRGMIMKNSLSWTSNSDQESKGPGKPGHLVADTNVSPFARARNICCGLQFCVRDTRNVSDFVHKHFVSAKNDSQCAQPKKHHGQQ